MKRLSLLALAALLALAVAAPAVAGGTKGITDDKILIGQWGPQTGPAALWGAVARGSGVYCKMLNEDGGVNGRMVDYYMRDDGYQPNRTKAIVKELSESVGVFGYVGGVGTAPGMAVMPYLVENNIPWVGPSSGSLHWTVPPKKNVFGIYVTYLTDSRVLTGYALDKMGKKKVGFLYQNDDYGKGGMEGVLMALGERGMEIAAMVSTEVTDTDLSTQVLKLKEAGCDVVIMWLLPKQAAITLGTAAKMGYSPTWMTSTTLSDSELMYKITRGLWKGVIFSNAIELPDSTHPLMVKFHEYTKKVAPKERWGTFFYSGLIYPQVMCEALRRCGRDITVQGFYDSLNSFKGWHDGIGAAITFTAEKRQGVDEIFLAEVGDGGKAKRISDWIGPDDLPKVQK